VAGNGAGTRRGRTLNAAFLTGLKVPGSSEQKAGWQRHYPRSTGFQHPHLDSSAERVHKMLRSGNRP
jgi:hypothetical protein